MREDAKPSKQRPYTYNENFANKIKEEINKLLDTEFIYEIEHTEWVSLIEGVPKNNKKLRVCVNLKKVNATTKRGSLFSTYHKPCVRMCSRQRNV